jgi:hypothetical protein
MQGHSFEVERIAKARIARLAALGSERDLERAVAQDNLAHLYNSQRRNEEAIPLLRDSLAIFERLNGALGEDTGICCKYLSRTLLHSNQFVEAEVYARRSLDCAKATKGDSSLDAAMAADECSVAIAFSAQQLKSADKARESIQLSEWALQVFEQIQGADGKETRIGKENNRRLKLMLSQSLPQAGIHAERTDASSAPVPSFPFISHSYDDKQALADLLAQLPAWCKPIVFEPITVSPTEYVSEKLISGILGANGLIFIDSPKSNASFWTAFERDLAARNRKPMMRFDPVSRKLSSYEVQPRRLLLAHLYHPADAGDVGKIMGWLVGERSFEAFDDPGHPPNGRIPPFAQQDPYKRDAFLSNIRTFGAVYLIFLSPTLLANADLLKHAAQQVAQHPRSTLICWLESSQSFWPSKDVQALQGTPKERSFKFSRRPSDPSFSQNELDDLGVRLFWLIHQSSTGDWFR